MNQQTRRGVILHKTNPFLPNAEVATKTRKVTSKRGNMMLISNENQENISLAGFWETEVVDSTKFIKLFANGIKALAALTGAGSKVFELLCEEVQNNIGKDKIYLSHTNVDHSTISRQTFARGVAELIDKQFIAATPAVSIYWINPAFIWNGDRLAFVKEYRKSSTLTPAIPTSIKNMLSPPD